MCWSYTCNLSLKILVPSGTQLNCLETKLPLSYHPQAMHHVEIPSLRCSKSTNTLTGQLTNLHRCHRLTFWRSEALISDCTPNLATGICRNSHQKNCPTQQVPEKKIVWNSQQKRCFLSMLSEECHPFTNNIGSYQI